MTARVDAILMASGFSRRFGMQNKLLVPFGGMPLAQRTLTLVCGSGFFNQVFFVWADAAVGKLADGYPVVSIHNRHPQHGSRESVRLGVQASGADYYMFFPCDQPLMDAKTVEAVLAASAPGKIAFPQFEGKPSTPSLFSSHFRAELLALGPCQQARAVKQRHPDALVPVELPNFAPLADVDTLNDLDLIDI